ncbi:hypothetical protein PTKU46_92730 [Paraburkholderia terrae]
METSRALHIRATTFRTKVTLPIGNTSLSIASPNSDARMSENAPHFAASSGAHTDGFPDANELSAHAGYAGLHQAWRLKPIRKTWTDLDLTNFRAHASMGATGYCVYRGKRTFYT